MISCLLTASSKTVGGFEYFLRIPNGGLASIAANTDPSICTIKILDLVIVQSNPLKYFTKYIKRNKPDVIGFSCMVFQFHEILELAKISKALNPNVITVLGGYYPTVNYKNMTDEELSYFDFIIRGEGERAFDMLIKALNNKEGFSGIPNLSYKVNGTIFHNETGPLLDLNKLKPPNRNSRVFSKGFYYLNHRADVVETSRGCTFTCSFCSITLMYGRSYRQFPVERIIDDIKDAAAHGAKAIFFNDDNITINIKHFENLCNSIIANNLNHLKYFMQASVKGFYENPHLYKLIKEAGFESVFLGIESDDDEILGFFNKDNQFKSSYTEKVVKELQKEKIFVIGGLIFGLPADNKETMWKRYEYSKALGLDFIVFFALTPYPGTKLREELIAKGYVTNLTDFSKYDSYRMNIRTDNLDSKELFEAYDAIVHSYTVDSKGILRLMKRFPIFFAKSLIKFIFLHPDMVFHHLTKGKFLNTARFD